MKTTQNPTILNASGTEISESGIGNRYLFQGREYDAVTGLYYFRARWYDPETGRWLSKDPLDIEGGLNLYVFCDNNPVIYCDPAGLDNFVAGGGVSLVFGMGVEGSVSQLFKPDTPDLGWAENVGVAGGFNISADLFVGHFRGNTDAMNGDYEALNVSLAVCRT
ncbi:MAG: RHS repeat-associated core domain-containing protein [Pontiellaceae bacterium]|nr:RHS repeat-associated core domain-containing protein [Pontiellaceae bacterium]MBN2784835.1 RHS repeat-associated core domain-containing protein [Pontiellaceae bacterium]